MIMVPKIEMIFAENWLLRAFSCLYMKEKIFSYLRFDRVRELVIIYFFLDRVIGKKGVTVVLTVLN